MKNNPIPKLALLLAATAASSHAQVLFSDNFDAFGTPITVTTAGTAAGYNVLFNGSSGPEDFSAIFGYDYSALGIPSAPGSTGGSTRGLQLTVNKDATAAAAAVNLYPVGQSFSGNFTLSLDIWFDFSTGSTTEHALFGINHSGTTVNRVGKTGSDGVFFAMDGDGGASATSTTLRDFSPFFGQGDSAAPLLLRTNNFTFGPAPLLGDQLDSNNPGFQTLFPPSGLAGNQWVRAKITQEDSLITWTLNDTVVAQMTNSTPYTSGNILLGYNDTFNSASPADVSLILDNISVTQVPEPTVAGLVVLGLGAMMLKARRKQS